MKAKEIKLNEIYLFVATDDASRKYLEGKPFTPTHVANGWTLRGVRGLHEREAKRFFDCDNNKALPEELQPLPEDFIYPGMQFIGVGMPGMAEVMKVNETAGTFSVKVNQGGSEWEEDEWPLEDTRFELQQGRAHRIK